MVGGDPGRKDCCTLYTIGTRVDTNMAYFHNIIDISTMMLESIGYDPLKNVIPHRLEYAVRARNVILRPGSEPFSSFVATRSTSRYAFSSSCLLLLASPDSDGGGLVRARTVSRRGVLFNWSLGWNLGTYPVPFSCSGAYVCVIDAVLVCDAVFCTDVLVGATDDVLLHLCSLLFTTAVCRTCCRCPPALAMSFYCISLVLK